MTRFTLATRPGSSGSTAASAWLLGLAMLVAAGGASASAAPKATGANAAQAAPGEPAPAKTRLSSAQKRMIYQSIVNDAGQSLPPKTKTSVGTQLPPDLSLSEIPSAAAEQVPAVASLEYVKLGDGKVLLVDPATRRVAFAITKKEGTLSGAPRKGAKPAASPTSAPASASPAAPASAPPGGAR